MVYGFRKLGVVCFWVLIIRILLFRVLYLGPLVSETPGRPVRYFAFSLFGLKRILLRKKEKSLKGQDCELRPKLGCLSSRPRCSFRASDLRAGF